VIGRFASLFVGLAFFFSAVSCAGVSASGPLRLSPAEGMTWEAAVKESTRRDEVYDSTIRQADLRATLVTPRLRKAFSDSRVSFHGKLTEELEQELVGFGNPDEGVDAPTKSAPTGEQEVLLFIALYVADPKNRDISASYTIWDTRLVVSTDASASGASAGTIEIEPTSIEPIRLSPAVTELFPYVDRFDEFYIARFPLFVPGGVSVLTPGRPLRLTVKSALADLDVAWSLAGSSGSSPE